MKNYKYKNFKRGNTLSETLITLVILGIVFVLTAGTIVADYKKNETVVRLKKMYSTMTQAFKTSEGLNGNVHSWEVNDGIVENASYNFYKEYLSTVLSIAKDCKNSTEDTCDFEFKELNGTPRSLSSLWARFFLNDGAFVAIQTSSNDDYKVVYFYIDTNGKKRLNVVARDIFLFEYWIQNNKHPDWEGQFFPYGHEYSREQLITEENDNNCNRLKNGNYCSSLIIKDNWQIIKGYPWAQARYVVQ